MVNPIDLDDVNELNKEFLEELSNNAGDEEGVEPNGGHPKVQ